MELEFFVRPPERQGQGVWCKPAQWYVDPHPADMLN